jgi:hypothetical protein
MKYFRVWGSRGKNRETDEYFDTKEWTMAVGPRVRKVTKFGKQSVNIFGLVTYSPNHDADGIAPDWLYKVNVTFLLLK